jgi:hypothetical protein
MMLSFSRYFALQSGRITSFIFLSYEHCLRETLRLDTTEQRLEVGDRLNISKRDRQKFLVPNNINPQILKCVLCSFPQGSSLLVPGIQGVVYCSIDAIEYYYLQSCSRRSLAWDQQWLQSRGFHNQSFATQLSFAFLLKSIRKGEVV